MPRPKDTTAWVEANARTFRRRDNARANSLVRQKMTEAEKETGLTAEQLAEVQRRLREALYARSSG